MIKSANIKRYVAIFLVVLMSMNTFGAIVSDSDGAAFVTKVEFDALKRDFDTQIENYNTSIDQKIDGAIANYLFGLKTANAEIVKLDPSFNWTFPIICMNNSEWNDTESKLYGYEMPDINFVSVTCRGDRNNDALIQSWNATTPLNSYRMCTEQAFCVNKRWYETKDIKNEMIEINDNSLSRVMRGGNVTSWNVENVGKGRHRIVGYETTAGHDAGHIQAISGTMYWGYTWLMGVGVNTRHGYYDNMKTDTYANWTPGTWQRTTGDTIGSSLGWGGQTSHPFAEPRTDRNLNGARQWAEYYTAILAADAVHNKTNAHSTGKMQPYADDKLTEMSIVWENDKKNQRQWVYTGESLAPATSTYGWFFEFVKPATATQNFEGYYMCYQNDLGMITRDTNRWASFHSWCPGWYWRYKAGGSIGTKPSTSEFSALEAKKIYYYDNKKNIHYFDEGLFLLNLDKQAEYIDFSVKWDTLDGTSSNSQLTLKISKTPFNTDHDNTTDLAYSVNDNDFNSDQIITCGDVNKIRVMCDAETKQLYMMWEPVTSGSYLGLSQLSDFMITLN